VFEHGLHQEQTLADEISIWLNLSIAERHAPTQVFLQWFISEQVEEEALFTRYIKKLKRNGSDANGLMLLDMNWGRKLDPAGGAAVDHIVESMRCVRNVLTCKHAGRGRNVFPINVPTPSN